jgi:hypothetical protein
LILDPHSLPLDYIEQVESKQAEGDQMERFKAHLVVCGCEQRKGIDFEETFAPIVKWVTIKVVVALGV